MSEVQSENVDGKRTFSRPRRRGVDVRMDVNVTKWIRMTQDRV